MSRFCCDRAARSCSGHLGKKVPAYSFGVSDEMRLMTFKNFLSKLKNLKAPGCWFTTEQLFAIIFYRDVAHVVN
jgi:hypothetical protein